MGEVVYGWTGGVEGAGLPFPIADQSSPNAARDIQYLAERIVIDADDPANLQGLPTSGQPLAFYGEGRPDTGYPELRNVVTGSTFTCTDPDDFTELTGNWGARQWIMQSNGSWLCVDGDTRGWVHKSNKDRHSLRVLGQAVHQGFQCVTAGVVQNPGQCDGRWRLESNAIMQHGQGTSSLGSVNFGWDGQCRQHRTIGLGTIPTRG